MVPYPGIGRRCGRLYAMLRNGLACGLANTAGLGQALKLTQMMRDILAASLAGSRKQAANRPER